MCLSVRFSLSRQSVIEIVALLLLRVTTMREILGADHLRYSIYFFYLKFFYYILRLSKSVHYESIKPYAATTKTISFYLSNIQFSKEF